MRRIVAVKPRNGFDPSVLKRDALLFHQIAVPKDPTLPFLEDPHKLDIPEWMYEESVLIEPTFSFTEELVNNSEFEKNFDSGAHSSDDAADALRRNAELNRIVQAALNLPKEQQLETARKLWTDEQYAHLRPAMVEVTNHFATSSEFRARAMSVQLRQLERLQAYPLLSSDLTPANQSVGNEIDVYYAILNELPMPGDSVPWEQIHDFRSDEDSMRKFSNLIEWVGEVDEEGISLAEIQQRIEQLIAEHREFLTKQHSMNIVNVALKGIVRIGAIAATKFAGPLAAGPINFLATKINLTPDEFKAPGKEIAYIVKAQQRFSR